MPNAFKSNISQFTYLQQITLLTIVFPLVFPPPTYRITLPFPSCATPILDQSSVNFTFPLLYCPVSQFRQKAISDLTSEYGIFVYCGEYLHEQTFTFMMIRLLPLSSPGAIYVCSVLKLPGTILCII